MAPPPMHDSAVLPCSMAAQLSATGLSHHSPLPHIPSTHLSGVNSSPHPGIAPQSLNSSSQPLHLSWCLLPCLGYVRLWQELILTLFRLPQISCLSLSLKCFFSDSDNCPYVGYQTSASVNPPAKVRSRPTKTPVFPPCSSSYRILRSSIYSFPLVRYPCLLSACVLHALLCLKVYS